MTKLYISAINPLQAEEYARYLGLKHDEWVYLHNQMQLWDSVGQSIVISLRSAVLLLHYVAICKEITNSKSILINVGW